MEIIIKGGTTLNVDEKIYKNNEELIKLILNTESMDDSERQYWLDILPKMNDNNIIDLMNILVKEKKELNKLEIKYQDQIKEKELEYNKMINE